MAISQWSEQIARGNHQRYGFHGTSHAYVSRRAAAQALDAFCQRHCLRKCLVNVDVTSMKDEPLVQRSLPDDPIRKVR